MFGVLGLAPCHTGKSRPKWKRIAGTSLDVSSDISVSCNPLRWAGTCIDNQPPCYCETRSEGINYFKQPLETGCDPTHTHKHTHTHARTHTPKKELPHTSQLHATLSCTALTCNCFPTYLFCFTCVAFPGKVVMWDLPALFFVSVKLF